MDFVRSHFGTNEPLTNLTLFSSLFDWFDLCAQQTSQTVRKKVFNWSEVQLYRSNFLQNPYFSSAIIYSGGAAGRVPEHPRNLGVQKRGQKER